MANRSDRQPDEGAAGAGDLASVEASGPAASRPVDSPAADAARPAQVPGRRRIPTIPHPRGRELFPAAAKPEFGRPTAPSSAFAPGKGSTEPFSAFGAGKGGAEPFSAFGPGESASAAADSGASSSHIGSGLEASPPAPSGAGRPGSAAGPAGGLPAGQDGPRRRRMLLLTAAAAVALITAGVLWSLRGPDAGKPQRHSEAQTAAGAGSPASLQAQGMSPTSSVPASPTVSVPASPTASVPASPTATAPSPAPKNTTTGLSAAANPAGVNLALNRPVTASGSEGEPWAPANAVDGKPDTRWSSAFSDPQWITVDLGKQWTISKIKLSWERAYAVAYRVQISADGSVWNSVYSTSNGQGGEVTVEPGQIIVGRYVRVYGTERNGQYGYSLFEIDVR